MKLSLARRARRLLSAVLATAMLASSTLAGVTPALASAASPPPEPASGPPGVSATASPAVLGEIEASRTAVSSTYALSDGTRRAEIFTQPVHYRAADGTWDDIDPTLVPTAQLGEERAKSVPFAETFGSGEGTATPVTISNGRWSLGMELVGGAQGDPFTLGDRAVYPLAQTDTQLAYESRRDGVKDTLVLASPAAPDSFTFRVALLGLKLFAEPGGGGLALYDAASGKLAGRIEPLSVFDSADKHGAPTSAACVDASMTVAQSAAGTFVTYRVPRAWLDDPARAYPVYVDPTVTFAGPDDTRNDTFVGKGDSAYHYADTHLDAGLFGSGDLRRALINFGLGSMPRGSAVNSAILQMYLWQNSSTGSSVTMAQPVLGAWGYNATWANSFGNGSVALGPGLVASTIAGGANHYAYWDLTSMVQRWTSGALPNNGVALFSASEGTVAQHSFWSAEYTAFTSRQPHLVVDYMPPVLTADAIPTTERVGDTVRVTIHAKSRVTSNVQARVDSRLPSGATTQTAGFAYTASAPGDGWSSTPVGGGYLSFLKTPAVNSAAVVPDASQFSAVPTTDGVDVTFAYRIGDAHGDVQNNRLSMVDYDWQSAWQDSGQSYQVVPVATDSPSATTTASLLWHDEAASVEASAGEGRGSVALSWPSAAAATGYGIYLFDGNQYEQVATTTATSWSSAGRHVYPSDSAIASLPAGYSGAVFGSGTVDLRDDPRPLYSKTVGSVMDGVPAYAMKVCPFNSAGSAGLSACETLTVSLPGRTKHLADEPSHANVDVGPLGPDAASVRLDRGDLTLSASDLAIAGIGPDVRVDRFYRSSDASSSLSARGWRFSFERAISASATSAVYLDAEGDAHVFRRAADAWVPPHGSSDTLTGDSGGGFTLAHKDLSAETFDTSGRLASERDAFGNTVRYEWAGDDSSLVIRSPKDVPLLHERRITVTIASGKVVRAAAHVGGSDADRVVTYDAQASALRVTRFPGTDASQTTVYRYDGSGRIGAVAIPGFARSSAGEAAWSIAYGSSGTSLTVANETGADTPRAPRTATWNAASGIGGVTSASGVRTYAFDPLGELISSTQENTSAATVDAYDVEGDRIVETSPGGRVQSWAFDGRGNVVVDTEPGGEETRYEYAGDRCVRETDARGAVTTRAFDPTTGALLVEESTLNDDGQRSHVDYRYNADGAVATERRAVTATLTAQTDFTDYADSGQPQTLTKRAVEIAPGVTQDLVSRTTYDGYGDALGVVDPLGVTTAMTSFDAAGRPIEATDASGTVEHTRYGLLGNEVSTWRSNPSTSTLAERTDHVLNGAGDPVADVARASDGTTISVTVHTYDAAGRQVGSDDSSKPGAEAVRYDAQGNEAQIWFEGANPADPASAMRTAYTADGEEASSTEPGAIGASTVTNYTPDGEVARRTTPGEGPVSYAYDRAGDLTRQTVQTDAGPRAMSYRTDLSGRLVAQTDTSGATSTAQYDLDGNQVASSLGDQSPSTTRYNAIGWQLESRDPDGVVTSDSYDACGRLIAESVGPLSTRRTYDGCGRLISQTGSDGTLVEHAYDWFGNETATTQTNGRDTLKRTTTTYDLAGRVASESTSWLNGQSVTTRSHTYSADGRDTVVDSRGDGRVALTTVVDGLGRQTSQSGLVAGNHVAWSVSATDAAGRTTSLLASGLAGPSTAKWTEAGRLASAALGSDSAAYSYSPLTGKKLHETLGFALGSRVETGDYSYDAEGRLAQATLNGITTTYSYDPASGALTSRRVGACAPVDLSYESSGTGRLLSAGGRTYRADSLGRRIAEGSAATPTATVYAWSGDRLASVTTSSSAAHYTYDGDGQRLESVVTSGGVTTTTRFEYAGTCLLGLCAAGSDGTSWSVDYVYGDAGALVGGVYTAEGRSTTFSAETTDRGDVRELLDESGSPFASYCYDAFGIPTQTVASATASVSQSLAADIAARQPLRYATYAWDAESGLYYCSARYYDPDVSAFLSKDPDRFDGDASAYQYCSGDPVDNVDPTGCDVWGSTAADYYTHMTAGEIALVKYCQSRVGGAYKWGGKSRPGHEWDKVALDCSGLTSAAYRVAHRAEPKVFPTLPDGAASQHDATKSLGFDLKASKLRISDLGFLHKGGKESGQVHHVGIYIGHSTVVEARGKRWGVVKTTVAAFNKRGADWHRGRKH